MTAILFNTVGILLFLFLFWRRLKEDYVSNIIFTTAFYILLGVLGAEILSSFFFGQWWFWFDFLGILAGLAIGILRFRLRIFETLEALVVSLLPWLSLLFLRDAIEISSLVSFFVFVAVLFYMVLFYFLDAHYKKFTWYKSGRIGFSGLTTLGTLFLTRSAVAAFLPGVLSFVGRIDAIVSGIVSFIAFLLVYNLAKERT